MVAQSRMAYNIVILNSCVCSDASNAPLGVYSAIIFLESNTSNCCETAVHLNQSYTTVTRVIAVATGTTATATVVTGYHIIYISSSAVLGTHVPNINLGNQALVLLYM